MRILVIGGFYYGSLTESYARALEQNGHEVFRFDSDQAYFQAGRLAGNRWTRRLFKPTFWNRMNRTTIEMVGCLQPKLVVVIKGTYLHPETIRLLRALNHIPVVNYYPDNPYCGVPLDPRKTSAQRRDLMQVLREYSRVFIWGQHLVARLARHGVPASYLPFGVDSEQFRPQEQSDCAECGEQHAAVFVGLCRKKRQKHIQAIRHHRVGLWGPGWNHIAQGFPGRHIVHNRPAFGSAGAELYSSATVSLNIVDDLNMPGHNMRTFEIPASGGLMLSTYTEEQAEFFPEGEAAWYYRDPGEIDQIIARLAGDQEAQKRTRMTARQIARDHDYRHRAEALLKEVFGKGV